MQEQQISIGIKFKSPGTFTIEIINKMVYYKGIEKEG